MGMHHADPAGQDLLLAHSNYSHQKNFFTRIPSPPNEGTLKEWTIELPFDCTYCLPSSRDNLLAAVEKGRELVFRKFLAPQRVICLMLGRFMKIHLLNLLDGSPHDIPLYKILPLDLRESTRVKFVALQISSSMIALVVRVFSSVVTKSYRELIVWNWRTGEVVGFFFFSQEASFNFYPGVPTFSQRPRCW